MAKRKKSTKKAAAKKKGRKKLSRAEALRRLPLPMLKSNLMKLSRIIQQHPDNQ